MASHGVADRGGPGKFQAMPRGRHRHSPSLHRLLPPSAIAAFGLACAGGAWLVGDPGIGDSDTVLLRGFAAAAALAGISGAVLARRWDRGAGRRVAELKARQTRVEWRAEERQADLEGDLDEARKVREALEAKLLDKRTELAGLRTEHAALLRRYAQAETGRASALEGRRQLEIEAGSPARALTADATDHRAASGAPTPLTYLQASEALRHLKRNAVRQQAQAQQQAQAPQQAQAQAQQHQPPQQAPVQTGQEQLRPVPAPGATASALAPRTAAPLPPQRDEQAAGSQFDFFGSAKGDSKVPADEEDEPAPAPAAPAQAAPGVAGKVIDLAESGDGDAEGTPEGDGDALDITELRSAIS